MNTRKTLYIIGGSVVALTLGFFGFKLIKAYRNKRDAEDTAVGMVFGEEPNVRLGGKLPYEVRIVSGKAPGRSLINLALKSIYPTLEKKTVQKTMDWRLHIEPF